MDTGVGAPVDGADPVQLVRRWELQHGRHLVDPLQAAWDDLDSESVVRARHHWGAALPSGTPYWRRRRYLSFDAEGQPDRLVEVQLLSAHQPAVLSRHSDLLVAGALGQRYWIYALTSTPTGEVFLRTLQDPARSAWDPASPGVAVTHDPLWVLPLSRVAQQPVLVVAA